MPRKGGHENECSKDEIEPIYDQLITPVKHGKDARDVVETAAKETPTRTRQKFSEEFKLHCARDRARRKELAHPDRDERVFAHNEVQALGECTMRRHDDRGA